MSVRVLDLSGLCEFSDLVDVSAERERELEISYLEAELENEAERWFEWEAEDE